MFFFFFETKKEKETEREKGKAREREKARELGLESLAERYLADKCTKKKKKRTLLPLRASRQINKKVRVSVREDHTRDRGSLPIVIFFSFFV